MNDTISTINQQIDAEADKLRSRLVALEDQVKETKDELARLESARSVLSGKKPRQVSTAQKKSGKPAPTKEKVAELVEHALRTNGKQNVDSLKSLVSDGLAEAGYSQVGFSLRFKEVLASERFNRHRQPAVA